MFTRVLSFAASLLCSTSLAQSQEVKDAYPLIAGPLEKMGVTWEPIKVKTENGWTLTMFHLTGKVDTGPTKTADRPSLIFQHGMGGDASEWVSSINQMLPEPIRSDKPTLAVQMMEMGFDVFLANIAGCRYSQENDNYTPEDPEFWQMDWRQYGQYDIPAFVGEIRKRNGGKKVAYVGHSQGTTQSFAGMGLIPEWYDENISTSAFLGPCVTPNWEQIQDVYVESDMKWLHDNGIYVLNYSGDSW